MVSTRLSAFASSQTRGPKDCCQLQANAHGVRFIFAYNLNLYRDLPHSCSLRYRAARRLLLPFLRRAIVGSQVIMFFSLTTAAERLQRHWHAHVTRCFLKRRQAEKRRAAAAALAAKKEDDEGRVASRELGLHAGAVASFLQAVWRGHVTRGYVRSIKQRKVMHDTRCVRVCLCNSNCDCAYNHILVYFSSHMPCPFNTPHPHQLLLARLARAKRSIRRIPRGPGGRIEREDAVAAIQRVYRYIRQCL